MLVSTLAAALVLTSSFASAKNDKSDVLSEPALALLGPYSPYISQAGTSEPTLPKTCSVSQVNILARHGARSPTASANKVIQGALAQVVNRTSVSNDSALDFIKGYTFTPDVDQLTDFGRKQSYEAGVEYAKTYKNLLKRKLPSAFIRAASETRVVESAGFFQLGLQGKKFDLSATLPTPDVVLIESSTFNNTLDVDSCAAVDLLNPDPGDVAEANWLTIYTPGIAERLEAAFPGSNLTGKQVNALMSLCGFDTLQDVNLTLSGWCDAFEADEWVANEYYFDVSKYYGHGYGFPYHATVGASYVNELVSRLTSNTTLVQAGSSNLSTSLGVVDDGMRLYADFSHDNNMVQILSALGLVEDPALPTLISPDAIPSHNFVVSSLVMFSGRVVFERVTCTNGHPHKSSSTNYLRVLINNAVQTSTTYPDGLIPLSDWLASPEVQFAQSGGDWERCDEAPANATVRTY